MDSTLRTDAHQPENTGQATSDATPPPDRPASSPTGVDGDEARRQLDAFAASLARLAVQYAGDSAATKAQTPAAEAGEIPSEAAA